MTRRRHRRTAACGHFGSCTKQARRLLTVAEQRRLVASMPNRTISALVAVLGETAMRESDGLRLRWDQIDSGSRTVSVEIGKTGEVVCIPLSEFAVEALVRRSRLFGGRPPYPEDHSTSHTEIKPTGSNRAPS
ncbi:MAG: tyrosine-type recombinase/integrase [Acidobacteriota bacterium]